MKKRFLLFVFLSLTTWACASTLRSEIESMNKVVGKCLMKRDIAGFKKSVLGGVTADFKYIEGGRTQTFDEMIATMAQSFKTLTKVNSVTTKILSLKEGLATATSKERHTMSVRSMGPDKKAHTMIMIGVSTNTYRKEGGKWKMSVMDWKNEKMTMDGKPMDPSMMGG